MRIEYSPEARAYIEGHYKGTSHQAMADQVNERYGLGVTKRQMATYYKNHHLNSGLTGRYQPGHVPANKGVRGFYAPGIEKGWYKPGQLPHNTDPIGTEIKREDGYWWRKVRDNPRDFQHNWKQVHRILWEQAYGPIPKGMMLRFRDGNPDNLSLDNLMLCTMGENGTMNKHIGNAGGAEFAETRLLMAKIKIAAGRKK